MQFKIEFDQKINPVLYEDFSRFLYQKVVEDVRLAVRRSHKNYRARESAILQCSLIKWRREPPKSINLVYYLSNCLVLKRVKGTYVIKLNDTWLVKGSLTKVSLLIRILEYGTDKIPPRPLIRRILRHYSKNYQEYFKEFLEERMFDL